MNLIEQADAERKRKKEETVGTVHVVMLVYPKEGMQLRCFGSRQDMEGFVKRMKDNPRCPAIMYDTFPNQDIE